MKNPFEEKKEKLHTIYDRFERENMPYSQQAFCKAGCSFCCTYMGNIDIVTLGRSHHPGAYRESA